MPRVNYERNGKRRNGPTRLDAALRDKCQMVAPIFSAKLKLGPLIAPKGDTRLPHPYSIVYLYEYTVYE